MCQKERDAACVSDGGAEGGKDEPDDGRAPGLPAHELESRLARCDRLV